MVTYKIIYDITQDAYNWYNSLNNFGGIKKLKDAQDIEIAKKIMGLNFSEAKKILIPYLEERNTRIEMTPKRFKQIMNDELNEKFELAIKRLEEVTEHPLAIKDCAKNRAKEIHKISPEAVSPSEDLLFLITTFPAMIVYYEEGVIFTYAKIDNELWGMPLDGILHELMHFQTNYYYRENPDSVVSNLSRGEYYILKESLTALLDESWKPIMTLPDASYPEFQVLRDRLREYYYKYRDFDKLMEYGAKEVKNYKM